MTKCTCGGKLQKKSITLEEVILGYPVRVQGAPALVCERCGEEIVSLDLLERIESIVEREIAKENASRDHETRVISHRQLARV